MSRQRKDHAKRPLIELDTVAGELCAILHEDGKSDYIKPIPEDLAPFFNALIYLIGKKDAK